MLRGKNEKFSLHSMACPPLHPHARRYLRFVTAAFAGAVVGCAALAAGESGQAEILLGGMIRSAAAAVTMTLLIDLLARRYDP